MSTKSTPKPEEDDDFDFIEGDDAPIETVDLDTEEDKEPEEIKDYRPDFRKRIEDLLEERRFQKENRDFLDELDEIDEDE